MRKFCLMMVTALLLVCTLSGCKQICNNATIITDGLTYQTDWIESNFDLAKNTTHVVKSEQELDVIFSSFPTVDFDKQVVIVYCYTTIYVRKQVLDKVVINGQTLLIEFDVVKGKPGTGDATAPQKRMLVVYLDKGDFNDVKVTYNGQ